MDNTKKLLSVLFGLSIFGLFIWSVGFNKILSILSSLQLMYVVLSVLLLVSSIIFRSTVWFILFRFNNIDIPFKQNLGIYTITLSGKLAIPVGYIALQAVVAYFISDKELVTTEEALSIITIGDLLNILPYYTIGVVAAVLLGLRGQLPDTFQSYVAIAILVLLVILLTFFTTWKYQTTIATFSVSIVSRIKSKVTKHYLVNKSMVDRINELEVRLKNIQNAVRTVFEDPLEIILIFALAHIGVLTLAGVFLLSGLALNIGFSFAISVAIVIVSKIGVLVPSPGGLGGVDAILIGASVLFIGLSLPEATTLTILYRVISYWMVLLLGAILSSYTSFNLNHS